MKDRVYYVPEISDFSVILMELGNKQMLLI